MTNWDQATYPTLAASIVKHTQKHGFTGDYLRYLRKAASFNKKGARRKQLPDGATRWHKGQEFLIERNGKTIYLWRKLLSDESLRAFINFNID